MALDPNDREDFAASLSHWRVFWMDIVETNAITLNIRPGGFQSANKELGALRTKELNLSL